MSQMHLSSHAAAFVCSENTSLRVRMSTPSRSAVAAAALFTWFSAPTAGRWKCTLGYAMRNTHTLLIETDGAQHNLMLDGHGGMITSTIHVLILVPVFFALIKERALRRGT